MSKKASSRECLLRAALQHFDDEGVLAVTLEEIRISAKVSVGSLYHHFGDKQALASALYLETLARFQGDFSAALAQHLEAQEGVHGAVNYVLDWYVAHPAEARLLFSGRGLADPDALRELNDDFFTRTMNWHAVHVHYEVLRPLPQRLIGALWLGPTFEYIRQEPAQIESEIRDALADTAWQSLRKEPQ